MNEIRGLSAIPSQRFRVAVLGKTATFVLTYRPAVQMWFIDLEYEGFSMKGVRVVRSVNMLEQYRNILPFGLLVDVNDGGEPFLVNDFQKGRVVMNILSEAELAQLEASYAE